MHTEWSQNRGADLEAARPDGTVVATCRRLKIPVRDYLGSVLPGSGDFPISRITELTPAAWATQN